MKLDQKIPYIQVKRPIKINTISSKKFARHVLKKYPPRSHIRILEEGFLIVHRHFFQ